MATDGLSNSALLAIARQALPRGNGFADVSPDDVVQEARLRLHAKHLRLKAEGRSIENPGAWMRTVIINVAIDLSRKKMRKAQVALDQESGDDGKPFTNEPASRETAPDEAMIQYQERDRVREAIRTLPPTQRAVMELELEGYNTEEMSVRLQVDKPAIRTRRCRAIQALQRQLAQETSRP